VVSLVLEALVAVREHRVQAKLYSAERLERHSLKEE
jgi:hypothetical protein